MAKLNLLEINIISAQDIARVSKSMQTYAVAWVHPDRKLTTRTDTEGGTNPTWNDKFVFRVDNQFLESDSSSVMIEIYCPHWFKPIHVGTVRVLVGNLIPPQTRTGQNQNQLGMRFVALQVRRSSGRPQGILNVGVTVLDSSMRSMPLYTLLSSAAGYQKFVDEDDHPGANKGSTSNNQPELRRSSSEKSSMVSGKGGSIVNMPTTTFANNKDIGSIVEAHKRGAHKKRDELYDEPLSIVDGDRSDLGLPMTMKPQDGKAQSVLSRSSSANRRSRRHPHRRSPSSVASRSNIGLPPLIKHINKNNHNTSNKSSPNKGYYKEYPTAKNSTAGSVLSVSDIGPSPSEVAAAIAEDSKYREGGRSMLEYELSEGVGTRLEKWRRDQPNNGYDYSPSSCDGSSLVFAGENKHNHRNHRHRHNDAGDSADGRFRCFGKICGYECSIVCGDDVGPTKKKKKKGGRRGRRPPPSSCETGTTYL